MPRPACASIGKRSSRALASPLTQGDAGSDQRLRGVDVTLRYKPGTFIEAEAERRRVPWSRHRYSHVPRWRFCFQRVLEQRPGRQCQTHRGRHRTVGRRESLKGRVRAYWQDRMRILRSRPDHSQRRGHRTTRSKRCRRADTEHLTTLQGRRSPRDKPGSARAGRIGSTPTVAAVERRRRTTARRSRYPHCQCKPHAFADWRAHRCRHPVRLPAHDAGGRGRTTGSNRE